MSTGIVILCLLAAILLPMIIFIRYYYPFNLCSECKSWRTRTRIFEDSSMQTVTCEVCGYMNTLPLFEEDEDDEFAF